MSWPALPFGEDVLPGRAKGINVECSWAGSFPMVYSSAVSPKRQVKKLAGGYIKNKQMC